MTKDFSLSAKYVKRLQEKGHRVTLVRKNILEILEKEQTPVSASEVALLLLQKGEKTHQTTVYRELAFLEKEGFVEPVRIGRATRYALIQEGHRHHLVCTECELVEDVMLENDLIEQEKKIERVKRFHITRHALEFFGVCRECAGKSRV